MNILSDIDKHKLFDLIKSHKPNIVIAMIIKSIKYNDLKLKLKQHQDYHKLTSLTESLYWIYHNTESHPLCVYCKLKSTDFISFKDGYKNHCSECRKYKFKESLVKTYQSKYGVDNYMELDFFKEKLKSKIQEKYGADNPMQLESNKEKAKNTSIKRYGFCHAMKNNGIKQKLKNSIQEKYGVDNPMQMESTKDKIKETNLKKYGVDWISQNIEIKKKMKDTCIEIYGFNCSSKNQSVKNKAIETSIKKYNTKYPVQNQYISEKIRDTKHRSNIIRYNEILKKICDDRNYALIIEYKTSFDKIRLKCKQCNREWEVLPYYLQNGYGLCPKCHANQSRPENEIGDFLLQHNINFKQNDRQLIKPFELDFLIESEKLAIEFCGLWWHSDKMIKDSNYHLNKLNALNDKRYTLITIFEDEWLSHSNVIKSKLSYIIGKTDHFQKIRASKCKIVDLSQSEKKTFFDDYHLQKDRYSKINIGLKYNDQIVSAASFNRYKGLYEYELIRFCTLPNVIVYGNISKILKKFESEYNPSILWSYCDRRWSVGKTYLLNNFVLHSTTKPNYWYWGKNIKGRSHRLNYSKKMLVGMEYYDERLTEFEIMDLNGYRRIFDCGNYKFMKVY